MKTNSTTRKYKNNEYNMNKRDFLIMKSWENADFITGYTFEQYREIFKWYKKPSEWKRSAWNGCIYHVEHSPQRKHLKILGANFASFTIGYLERFGETWYLVYRHGRNNERYIKCPDHVALFAEISD